MDKTIVTFNDEVGEKSTLTFDKSTAEGLHYVGVVDLHAWVQKQYDERSAAARQSKVKFTRRGIGDEIRSNALDFILNHIDDSELD